MNFRYNGENFYLDVIDSTDTGFRIFYDQDDAYYCGVANIANNYRTVGVSFELAGLVDNEPSTKAILLDSIMHFFGINLVGIGEKSYLKSMTRNLQLEIYPNPFRNRTIIRYTIQDTRYMIQDTRYMIQDINLNIYDISGRLVKSFSLTTDYCALGTISWDGTDDSGRRLSSGVYFVHLEADGYKEVEKVILLK